MLHQHISWRNKAYEQPYFGHGVWLVARKIQCLQLFYNPLTNKTYGKVWEKYGKVFAKLNVTGSEARELDKQWYPLLQ